MQEAEQLVCRPIVQLLPFIGVDIVHHQVNLLLLKLVKRGAFRNDAANEFVCNFNATFFIGGNWGHSKTQGFADFRQHLSRLP